MVRLLRPIVCLLTRMAGSNKAETSHVSDFGPTSFRLSEFATKPSRPDLVNVHDLDPAVNSRALTSASISLDTMIVAFHTRSRLLPRLGSLLALLLSAPLTHLTNIHGI